MFGLPFANNQAMRLWLLLTLISLSSGVQAQMQCFELFNIFRIVHGEDELWIKRGHKFSYHDRTNNLNFTAELDNDGIVFVDTQLVNKRLGIRSYQHGGQLYAQMIEHFGLENIKGISDIWSGETNFDQFRGNLRNQMSVEEAAFNTWSGRQAALYGFTKIASYEFIKVQESEYGDIPYPVHLRPFSLVFTRP